MSAVVHNLPKPPAMVIADARKAQTQICLGSGVCVNVSAPSPICLPLDQSGPEAWVCQGAVRTTERKCAVDTFTTPKGQRYRVRYVCTKDGVHVL